MIGRTVGNYVVTQVLGSGGMGDVYLAEHPQLGRRVAIKVLHRQKGHNPQATTRFLREARAAHQIGHPHIVEVFDFGQLDDGSPYLVMEWLAGRSLGTLLNQEPQPPLARSLHILAGIGTALAAAHAHGIVHRDLKPDNIFLITRDADADFVKVLDFGIAKVLSGQHAMEFKTQEDVLMGTPHYMSPEQCRGDNHLIDARSDVYSLGVIAFEMVTGRHPFAAQSTTAMLFSHIHKDPAAPRSLKPDLPAAVEAAILGALAKEPSDRFATVDDFLIVLTGKTSKPPALPSPAPTAVDDAGTTTVRNRNPIGPEVYAPSPVPFLRSPDSTYHPDFFIHRPREERRALQRLAQPVPSVVIQAPHLFGKATLLSYLLDETLRVETAAGRRCEIARVDLAKLDEGAFQTLDTLLHAVAGHLLQALTPADATARLAEAWARAGSAKSRFSALLDDHVLNRADRIFIAIEQAHCLLDHDYQDEYFGLLRGLTEEQTSLRHRLRLIVTVATEPALLVQRTERSSFFLYASPIPLRPFDAAQMHKLAELHGLRPTDEEIDALQALVGGHPYLARLACYSAAEEQLSLADFLTALPPDGGPFRVHLHQLHDWLRRHHLLDLVLALIAEPNTEVTREDYGRLYSQGLVVETSFNRYRLLCPLYEQYFGALRRRP